MRVDRRVAVTRVGVTGHVRLDEATMRWAEEALVAQIQKFAGPTLNGLTCLAAGADQLFARALLRLGFHYDVMLPARDYENLITREGLGDAFRELLQEADAITTMPFDRSSREAFAAASDELLARADVVFAVWDGEPSRLVGDTADVVRRARVRQIPIIVLWPPYARPTA